MKNTFSIIQVIQTGKLKKLFVAFLLLQSFLVLQACSGNGFHLRKNVDLPQSSQQITLNGIHPEHGLYQAFETALAESDGKLLDPSVSSSSSRKASTIINISNLREDKRVVSYTSERKVREYLVFLKFDYTIQRNHQQLIQMQRIRLDRSFIYDASFALGKAEEEDKIRFNLEKEAARIMMLRLQYLTKRGGS